MGSVDSQLVFFCCLEGAEIGEGLLTQYAVNRAGAWRPSRFMGHKKVPISVEVFRKAYATLRLPELRPSNVLRIEGCSDTCTMMVVVGP